MLVATRDGEYEVWTPDQTGACIGAGATPKDARSNAVDNMTRTCAVIKAWAKPREVKEK